MNSLVVRDSSAWAETIIAGPRNAENRRHTARWYRRHDGWYVALREAAAVGSVANLVHFAGPYATEQGASERAHTWCRVPPALEAWTMPIH